MYANNADLAPLAHVADSAAADANQASSAEQDNARKLNVVANQAAAAHRAAAAKRASPAGQDEAPKVDAAADKPKRRRTEKFVPATPEAEGLATLSSEGARAMKDAAKLAALVNKPGLGTDKELVALLANTAQTLRTTLAIVRAHPRYPAAPTQALKANGFAPEEQKILDTYMETANEFDKESMTAFVQANNRKSTINQATTFKALCDRHRVVTETAVCTDVKLVEAGASSAPAAGAEAVVGVEDDADVGVRLSVGGKGTTGWGRNGAGGSAASDEGPPSPSPSASGTRKRSRSPSRSDSRSDSSSSGEE